MILGDLIKICLTSLAAGVIIAVTVAILAVIVYLVAGVITSLVDTFKETLKEVRARRKVNKFRKEIQAILKFNASREQKTDSH